MVKNTPVLEKNFELINMKKWHQPVAQGAKQLEFFALRAFYLGIACESLGFNLYRAAANGTPNPTADTNTWVRTCDNQLVKSAVEFNDVSNYHKQRIIINCCRHLGATHTQSDYLVIVVARPSKG